MSQKRPILHYVIAYLLWAISTGFGILTLFLGRETVMTAIVVASAAGSPTASEQFYQSLRARAADTWSYLILGLLVLILLVALEHFYRAGVSSGSLLKRFFLVSGIECAVLLLTHATSIALQMRFQPLTWWMIVSLVVEALLGALFLWLRFANQRVSHLLRM